MEFTERVATAEQIVKVVKEHYDTMAMLPAIAVRTMVKKYEHFRMLKKDNDLLELTISLMKTEGFTDEQISQVRSKLGL